MTPNLKKLNFIVEGANERLDKIIASRATDISRSRIQKLIENNLVKVNGKILTDRSYQVKAGDKISITLELFIQSNIKPKDIQLDIVYEDEDLIVINKQAGLTVHPGAGNHEDTLVNALVHHTKGKLAGQADRPGIVHRLDKDTSGLMLVAKSDLAHSHLSQAIASREVTRIYVALIYGKLIPAIGTINTAYGRSKVDRKKMTVKHKGDKMAVTHYRVLEVYRDSISLVECKLETGRTHQIRVHMDHKKTPIVGDQTYGRSKNHNLSGFSASEQEAIRGFARQALHAQKIGFVHPRSLKEMWFETDLPEDMNSLINIL